MELRELRSFCVAAKLRSMSKAADKLEIGLEQVPTFLEDYGDIFLSLAYYRQCLWAIDPIIEEFIITLIELRDSQRYGGNTAVGRTCVSLEDSVNRLKKAILLHFDTFDRSTKDMWNNISAERFREVETMIRSQHITVGAILCALTVKMDAWAAAFPNPDAGGPAKRSDFIMTEMRQGIDKVRDIVAAARIAKS